MRQREALSMGGAPAVPTLRAAGVSYSGAIAPSLLLDQMTLDPPMDPKLTDDLTLIYEEVMWLAHQPNVTPSMARAWYTHVCAGRVKMRIRSFTGSVSAAAAADPTQTLRLEHYLRIQTRLTKFVEDHVKHEKADPSEFIRLLVECERVHIVTFQENYEALKAKGDYLAAGITLIPWQSLPAEQQATLWEKMLRGRVANAREFQPQPSAVAVA